MISLGYYVDKYKLLAFVLSTAIAGLAGSLKTQVFGFARRKQSSDLFVSGCSPPPPANPPTAPPLPGQNTATRPGARSSQ